MVIWKPFVFLHSLCLRTQITHTTCTFRNAHLKLNQISYKYNSQNVRQQYIYVALWPWTRLWKSIPRWINDFGTSFTMLHDSRVNASNTVEVSQFWQVAIWSKSYGPFHYIYINLNWHWRRRALAMMTGNNGKNLLSFQLSQWTKTTVPIDARINGIRSSRTSTVGTALTGTGSSCDYHTERYTRLHREKHSRRCCDHVRKCYFRLEAPSTGRTSYSLGNCI